MSLEKIRKNIDLFDSQILRLLNDRMEQALMSKKFKTKIEDSDREKTLIKKIRANSTTLINADFIEKIYLEILKESKSLQAKDYMVIAFRGEHGAYSEVAAAEWENAYIPVSCREYSDVLDGVHSGLYDYGIVPVENSLGGVIGEVNELLANTDLHVVGVVELPIYLCLLAIKDTDHREIRTVYSNSQSLAQCRNFLARNRLEPITTYDTAAAAKMIAENGLVSSAVIASSRAAEIYNLEIIKDDIDDYERNITRFLILSKEINKAAGEKCTVLFSTEHKAGTLFRVLEVFAKADINLTRIVSMPGRKSGYGFFLDFIGSSDDGNIQSALKKLEDITSNFRLMGCYKEKIVE